MLRDFANTATVLAIILSWVIPNLSSLVSNNKIIPAWAGGYVTLAIAAINGFVSQWAADPTPNHYAWQAGAITAAISFVVASLSRIVVTTGTPPDNKLVRLGSPGHRKARRGHYDGEHEGRAAA